VVGSLRLAPAHIAATVAVAVVVAVGGCNTGTARPTASPSPSPIRSGIRGTVLIGPKCQNPTPAKPCLDPYVARLVIVDMQGNTVAETTSGADGKFEVALPTGTYTIVPAPGGNPLPNADPIPVSVGEDVYTEVEIRYDTGIR
jgi:hypothetical protein